MNSLNPDILPNGLVKCGNNRYIKSLQGTYTGGMVFYSYNAPVVVIINNTVYRTSQYYSVTTSRHINEFLKNINCSNPEIVSQEVIDSFSKNN